MVEINTFSFMPNNPKFSKSRGCTKSMPMEVKLYLKIEKNINLIIYALGLHSNESMLIKEL